MARYTLVYGVLKLINFAHSEVFVSGAYAVWFTLSRLGFGPSAPHMNTQECAKFSGPVSPPLF